MYNADYVFYAAALKEVPSCEFFPMETVQTNVIGRINFFIHRIKDMYKEYYLGHQNNTYGFGISVNKYSK